MEEADYLRFTRPYDRALKLLRQELDFFVEDTGRLNIFSIENRLKHFASAVKKARSLDLPLARIHDLAALRVVGITSEDVEVVHRFFTRKEYGKELSIKKDKPIERNGYRARHLLVEIPAHYTRSPHEILVEVQLQTLLQHAFNHISRKWFYKADYSLPKSSNDDLKAIATELGQLDDRIGKLYQHSVKAAAATNDAAPLTPSSFQVIVKERFGEDVSIDNAVDSVQYLIGFFYDTNGHLRTLFNSDKMKDLLIAIAKTDLPHLAFLKDHGTGSEAYSLWPQI